VFNTYIVDDFSCCDLEHSAVIHAALTITIHFGRTANTFIQNVLRINLLMLETDLRSPVRPSSDTTCGDSKMLIMAIMKRLHAPSVLLAVLLLLGVMVACQEPELPSPVITTISPDIGPVGTEITVIGSNLGESIEQVKILFGGTPGITVAVNATRVLVKVPTLVPGTYSLGAELGGRQSKASLKFTVLDNKPSAFDLLSPGSLDPSFGDKGVARAQEALFIESPETKPDWLIQPDGKFVLVASGSAAFDVSRWNSDISRDKTFGADGTATLPVTIPVFQGASFPKIQRIPSGEFLVSVGATSTANPRIQIWTMDADGKLNQKFGRNGTIVVSGDTNDEGFFDSTLLPNGKVIAIGHNLSQVILKKYLSTGLIDNSFGTSGKLIFSSDLGYFDRITTVSEGKILIFGTKASDPFSGNLAGIVKIDSNGIVDRTFNFITRRSSGPVFVSSNRHKYIVERNEKIFVTSKIQEYGEDTIISGLLSNGSWDPFFQIITKEGVSDFIFGPDGSLLLFGNSVSLEKYDSNGVIDNKFGDSGRRYIPKNAAETVGTTFSGFISGNQLAVYGSLGSFVASDYAPSSRLFAARIRY
jgi:uncharacterized delta-60 repeat protein